MFDHMTQRQKDLLLAQCMYYLTMDQRHKIMREIPQAYNAWCQREVMLVVNKSEQQEADKQRDALNALRVKLEVQ